MSVNRPPSMKPLLYLSPTEPLPAPEAVSVLQAVIIDAIGTKQQTVTGDDKGGAAKGKNRPCPFFARIGRAETLSEADLGLLIANQIDGVVLAACREPADIQLLDVMLKVAEASAGVRQGQTAILAEYGTVPESVLSPHSLAGVSPRLSALIFDAEALAQACGCASGAGSDLAVILAGRAAVILRAREAGLMAYDTLQADATDEAVVRRLQETSLRNGFSALVARSPQQAALLATAVAE